MKNVRLHTIAVPDDQEYESHRLNSRLNHFVGSFSVCSLQRRMIRVAAATVWKLSLCIVACDTAIAEVRRAYAVALAMPEERRPTIEEAE
jgi:hypothetical protein